MKTSIVIFSSKQEEAEIKMNELIKDTDEKIVKRNKDTVETESKLFRARRWSLNQKATKAHELYIDTKINKEEIYESIIPCLISQFNDYNWRDHVHYFEV